MTVPGLPLLPNAFIVGAMKSATTSLAATLEKHPDIFVPNVKEPNFFIQTAECEERYTDLRYPRPGASATQPPPLGRARFSELGPYEKLFQDGRNTRVRLDASTMYLPSPCAARLIHRYVPSAKIIIVLRNPYDRAYSGYSYLRSEGREPAKSFAEAIESELQGHRKDWVYGARHLHVSMYENQVARYINYFGNESILIIRFEDLINRFIHVQRKIYSFLEVNQALIDQLERENATIIHKLLVLRALKYGLTFTPLRSRLRRHLPHAIVEMGRKGTDAAIKKIDAFGNRPSALGERERAMLAPHLEPELDRLELLLGLDLGAWRFTPSLIQSAG